jgi:Ca-activated chloride channel family protein
MLESFHFLRPQWLFTLVPTLVFYIVVRRSSPEHQWRRIIAPHLLRHLKVSSGAGVVFRPLHLITLLLTLGAIALAGPTWERERSPFAEDTAPLVIALDLSVTMDAVDVQPSRLERSKQKIRDLLALREGARTALLVYAGTAHTVLPLSNDASIFETFLSALETNVMPVEGNDTGRALDLAEELLARDDTPGSILFFTDSIATDDIPMFVEHQERSRDALVVLAVGTREGGPVRTGDGQYATDTNGRRIIATLATEGFDALASETGAFVASATVDDEDVRAVSRRIQSNLRAAQEEDETARWRDFGYYLTIPIAFLGALWFRKGWTVKISVALVLLLPGCSAEVWLTPDQQGRYAYEQSDYATAAERFEDPMWRGAAAYRAGDYDTAIDAFARVDAAKAYFNAGNAYARQENYEQAVASYEVALLMEPGWVEAEENLALVRSLIPVEPEDESPPQGGEPTFDADEVQFDEKGEQGTEGEVEMQKLTDEQLSEMWMRRLSDSPAAFLRRRFALESYEQERP